MNELNGLKKLSPEERIKRLREIEEKDKKEIEEAQKMLKESENEIENEIRIKDQVPIPQIKAVDISQLFTHEEKEMYKSKRGGSAEKKKEDAPLEETVSEEGKKIKEEQVKQIQRQYGKIFEEAPAKNVYQAFMGAVENASESGYVSAEQQGVMAAAYDAMKEKVQSDHYANNSVIQEEFSTMKQMMKYLR